MDHRDTVVILQYLIRILLPDVSVSMLTLTATAPNRYSGAGADIALAQPTERDRSMSRQRYRLSYRAAVAVAAVAGLALAASACSSNTVERSGRSGRRPCDRQDRLCAAGGQLPVEHKESVEDVAIFEKANPTITINSDYNYPCEVPATFTAMLRAGTEPDVFYTYFTDLPQELLAGQAADITQYVNTKTVPALDDIAPSSMKAVTAGNTIYGLPTSNYTQGLIYDRQLFSEAGVNPNDPPTTCGAGGAGRHRDRQARQRHRGLG